MAKKIEKILVVGAGTMGSTVHIYFVAVLQYSANPRHDGNSVPLVRYACEQHG